MKTSVVMMMVVGLQSGSAWASAPLDVSVACSLGTQWSTVDEFRLAAAQDSSAEAAAANAKALFVVGAANDSAYRSYWVVRKSLDRGKTWKTADRFSLGDDPDTRAQAIAVDPDTDHIYVAGLARMKEDDARVWVVRKSVDQGVTWTTVDRLTGMNTGLRIGGIAVGKDGAVYVVGTTGRNEWVVRRSLDGGTRWRTVDLFRPNLGAGLGSRRAAFPSTVLALPDGQVFVAGVSYHTDVGAWLVRHSANGLSDWKSVDELDTGFGASAEGGALHVDGSVVLVGRALDESRRLHWVVRKGNATSSERGWETIDDFVPNTPNGLGAAGAAAAVFSSDGELFVTGGKQEDGLPHDPASHSRFATRRGSQDSDALGSETPSSGNGLARSFQGDVLAVGKLSHNSETVWLARLLRCN